MFQAHIWWNKIKNNAMKMHLFKIGSKLTSQGNWKNMEQLVYHSFTRNICWSKIKNNTTVMCFVIYFRIGVLGTSRGHLFRTLLGRPWHVSPQFMRKWINLIVCTSWWCAELTSIREIFRRTIGRSSKMLQIQRTVALLIFVLTYVNICVKINFKSY